MEHASVIAVLGGPAKVAEALGCHRTRASHWAVDGIPPARFPVIVELARKAGRDDVTIDGLFRARAPQRRAVVHAKHNEEAAS